MNMIFWDYFPCYLCKEISIAFSFHCWGLQKSISKNYAKKSLLHLLFTVEGYKNQYLKIIVNIQAKHYWYDDTDLHTEFKTLDIWNKLYVSNNLSHCLTFLRSVILGFCTFPSAMEFFLKGRNRKSTFQLSTLPKQDFLHNPSSSSSILIIDLSISRPAWVFV